MIDKMQFLEGIGKIANMTNTTPPEGIGQWYKHFKDWNKADWVAACDACGTELNWFPKVAELVERKPKRYKTGAVENASGWMLETERQDERGPQEIETEIDGLTDPDLNWLFTNYGAAVGAELSIRMFRKNPNGKIYRGWIRDAIKERNRRQQN